MSLLTANSLAQSYAFVDVFAGISVNVADDAGFEVNLVPHTIANTAFAHTPIGAAVNLEVDLIARYVERLMQPTPISKG